jgi:hypothetical protein
LLQVWSVARKYAFNPPKIRFQKYYMNCHRQVKRFVLFVFFRSTPPRSPARWTTPSFPTAVLSPPEGRTRSQGRSQPARMQAPTSLRTRGQRRSGNGSRDLEGATGQVQAPASSRTRGHRRPGSGSRDLPSRSIRSRIPARGASTGSAADR